MFSTLHLAALETLTQPQPTICWPHLVGSYLATTHFRSAKSFSPQVALRLGCCCLITWHEKLCAIENQWGSINESATESATISAILSAPQHTEKNTQQWQQNTQNTMARAFFHALLTLVSLHLHWATLLQMAIEKWPTFRPQWTIQQNHCAVKCQPGPGHTSSELHTSPNPKWRQ